MLYYVAVSDPIEELGNSQLFEDNPAQLFGPFDQHEALRFAQRAAWLLRTGMYVYVLCSRVAATSLSSLHLRGLESVFFDSYGEHGERVWHCRPGSRILIECP